MEVDERKGKPSASKMKRYWLCPGSHKRADWLPSVSSGDATSGTKIHHAHETGDDSDLSQVEQSTYERGKENEKMILDRYTQLYGEPTWIKREHRFWCNDEVTHKGNTTQIEYSGQADLVVFWRDFEVVLVGDHKTGWVGADDAVDNDQVKALIYAAVVELEEQGESIREAVAVMIQPNVKGGLTQEVFGIQEIEAASQEIALILTRTQDPNPIIRPGHAQCRYCPAVALCPEANQVREELVIQSKKELEQTPESMAHVLNAGDLVDKIHKANRDQAKRLIDEEGWTIPGWEVQTSKGKSTIDTAGALTSLKAYGVSEAVLWTAVSITKTAIKKVLGITKNLRGVELDRTVDEVLKDHVKEGKEVKKLVRSRQAKQKQREGK